MEIDKKIRMSIEFLSPVTPGDQKRQSLVFSYLDVIVEAIDGDSHDVQLYGDISAEWVAGDHSSIAQWEFDTTNDGIS